MSPRSPGAGAKPQRGAERRGAATPSGAGASVAPVRPPSAGNPDRPLVARPPEAAATSRKGLDAVEGACVNAQRLEPGDVAGSSSGPSAAAQRPGGLVSETLTGQAPKWLEISEIDPLLEDWRRAKERYHRAHARQAERARKPTLAAWHRGRADTLAREYAERVDECETDARGTLRVWCRDCGEVHDHPIPCRVRALCIPCGRKAAQKRQRRVVVGLERAEAHARARWNANGRRRGQEPRASLLTFTVRHEDPEADRDVIARAWPNFRRALLHELGGGLDVGRGERRAPPYLAGWEITPGSKGDGHVHLHAAYVLPWVDREALKQAWERLTNGQGEMDMARQGSRAAHGETISTSTQAAAYVSKHGRGAVLTTSRKVAEYAAKAGAPPVAHLSPEVAGAWVRIAHARRMSTTSRRLLTGIPTSEPCKCGGLWGVNYERPDDGRRLRCQVAPRGPPVEGIDVSRETSTR